MYVFILLECNTRLITGKMSKVANLHRYSRHSTMCFSAFRLALQRDPARNVAYAILIPPPLCLISLILIM